MKSIYSLILLTCLSWFKISLCDSNCRLPEGCRIDKFYWINDVYLYSREFFSSEKELPKAFICEVKRDNYRFDNNIQEIKYGQCVLEILPVPYLEFRFKKSKKKIIDERFNFQGVIEYLVEFGSDVQIHLTNLNGFDIQLGIKYDYWESTFVINIIRSKIKVYSKNRLIKSCQDIQIDFGLDFSPISLFQIRTKNDDDLHSLRFLNCEFK